MAELSQQALATLAAHNVVPAAYIAHFCGPDGVWHGDTCGCFDDRCIGFHHDGADGCGCLEGWIEEFLKTVKPMAIGFNEEYSSWYVTPDLWDTDRPDVHLINPPVALAERFTEADQACREALAELVELAGTDSESGLAVAPCRRWAGYESRTLEWWTAQVPPSGSDEVWPAGGRGADIGPHHASAGDAVAWIHSMPETFHLLTAYGGAVQEIDRATLRVEAHSIRGGFSECEHCGHNRTDHVDAGEPREVGADA